MDFEKLKNIVNEDFLDRNLKCRQVINKETNEEETEVYLPLRCIDDLHLEEEEEIFIMEYLGNEGIKIRGSSSYYSGVTDNYTQYRKLHIYKSVYPMEKEKQDSCLKEYQKTKDSKIRNELTEANMHFVNKLAHRYHHLFDIDYDVLKSYGSEALIMAIEKYDLSRGSFHSYIKKCISYAMIRYTIRETFGVSGEDFISRVSDERSESSSYYDYFSVKRILEIKTGEKLRDNPELLENIALELEKSGYCEGELLEELKRRVSIYNPYSLEQIGSNLCCLDDSTLYSKVIEKVYQQELEEFIENVTEGLPEKKKESLRLYYGLGGQKSSCLQKIGDKEGVTHEAIRLRCKEGKELLRNKMGFQKYSPATKAFIENSQHEYDGIVESAYIKRK